MVLWPLKPVDGLGDGLMRLFASQCECRTANADSTPSLCHFLAIGAWVSICQVSGRSRWAGLLWWCVLSMPTCHWLKMITKMISRSTTILLSGGSTLVPFLCFTTDGRRTYMARIDVFQTFRLYMVVFFSWLWKNGHWSCILQVFAIFLHIKIIQRQINSNEIQIKFKNSINSKMIINR